MTQDDADMNGSVHEDHEDAATPTKRKRIPSRKLEDQPIQTPRKAAKETVSEFKAPTKRDRVNGASDTPRAAGNADRSARRKSARRLLVSNPAEDDSEEDELAGESSLAYRIRDEEEGGEDEFEASDEDAASGQERRTLPQTPSKRGRGRPRGSKKTRTPTPPRDLPPCEHYFFQNRPAGSKTSENTLSTLSLLSHEEYFNKMKTYKDGHIEEQKFLHSLHSHSFPQWIFELEEAFNVCVYGWGSKHKLLMDFAVHVTEEMPSRKVIVVNGYNSSVSIRDILNSVASTINSLINVKLGAQPGDMVTTITNALSNGPPKTPHVLLIHSIDSSSLRRPAAQTLLARLASSPHISVVASADTPNFPLMWDASLRAQFNWVFHDVTTFVPFDIEIGAKEGGVVDEVNALLGRSGRRMDGREGVMYVLRSLTENARSLFALLVAELLSMDDGPGMNYDDMDDAAAGGDFEDALTGTKKTKSTRTARFGAGIELRTLYQKASTQFIATNEHAFRGMLKEFYDHEMVTSRKDGAGAEVLTVPFRREELELILNELVGAG